MTIFNDFSPTDLKPFFFGGIASCVAEAVTFPIDTAKTRLQLQGTVFLYSLGEIRVFFFSDSNSHHQGSNRD